MNAANLYCRCLAATLLLLGSHSALADCTFTPGPDINTITLPASITVPANAVVGDVLWEGSTGSMTVHNADCSSSGWALLYGYAPGVVMAATDQQNVFTSNVDGIGIRLQNDMYGSLGLPGTYKIFLHNLPAKGHQVYVLTYALKIVLTGPVGKGGKLVLPSPLAGGYASTSSSAFVNMGAFLQILISGSPTISLPSCTVANLNVAMGKVSISDFGLDVGATTRTVTFEPKVSCPANYNNVSYKLSPSAALVPGLDATLSLDASSTASGVGVQLLNNNDSPLTAAQGLGAAAVLGSVPGGGAYQKTASGIYGIPLKARYIRTAATLKAGTAVTAAVIDLSYE